MIDFKGRFTKYYLSKYQVFWKAKLYQIERFLILFIHLQITLFAAGPISQYLSVTSPDLPAAPCSPSLAPAAFLRETIALWEKWGLRYDLYITCNKYASSAEFPSPTECFHGIFYITRFLNPFW